MRLSICCDFLKHQGHSQLAHKAAEESFKYTSPLWIYFHLVQHNGSVDHLFFGIKYST